MQSLGRIENRLNELREHVFDGTSTTETSIIEVLEIWQQIFREIFQQYHRLSTRLVRSEDTATALKVWHDYLVHVQSFLAETVPDTTLNEYRHLCEVHQNVLSSQKTILDNSATTIDQTLADRFNLLSNLHNETLSAIIKRHNEIQLRIQLWAKYNTDQSRLLDWLKEKEHEKSRLQLRYIHLQRIPHTLQTIETMLVQIKEAEADCRDLQQQQSKLLQLSDESSILAVISITNNAVAQRIQNLRASLESWKDFLNRISNLAASHQIKVTALETQFERVQTIVDKVTETMPQDVHCVENTLAELRAQRILLDNLTPELEAVTVIHEEIKENLSPTNVKTIRRANFILWQQQADLEQQLTFLIARIDERLSMSELFDMKYDRFIQWIDTMENRMDNESQSIFNESEEHLRRIEKELQAEITLRGHEKDW